MWPPVLLIAAIWISSIPGRTIGPIEGPLWSEALAEALGDPDETNDLDEIESIFRNSYEDNRRTEDNMVSANSEEDDLNSITAASQKRALSMFARWGTINSLGKGRTPIRSKVLLPVTSPEGGIVSAQTRGRMLGQPLRWG